MFSGQRYVRKVGKVRLCVVTLTELAMTKPLDYIFEGEELFWVESGEDEYGWYNCKNKIAVKLYRHYWHGGEKHELDGL